MATRTTQTVVRFASPFLLPTFEAPEPAGDYRVDCDEESVECGERTGWRRVAAFIHLPAIGGRSAKAEMAPVHPEDLDAAIEKDKAK